MNIPVQLSPMVFAIDLLRVNLTAMLLDDLQSHAVQVLDTIAALNDYLNSPGPKSADEMRNALRLADKLRAQMSHVRDLIDAHSAAVAMVGATHAAAAASLPQGAKPFGL